MVLSTVYELDLRALSALTLVNLPTGNKQQYEGFWFNELNPERLHGKTQFVQFWCACALCWQQMMMYNGMVVPMRIDLHLHNELE